jgi:Papain family cysteine protease
MKYFIKYTVEENNKIVQNASCDFNLETGTTVQDFKKIIKDWLNLPTGYTITNETLFHKKNYLLDTDVLSNDNSGYKYELVIHNLNKYQHNKVNFTSGHTPDIKSFNKNTKFKLGRIHSVDVRDLNYLIVNHLPQAFSVTTKTSQYWQDNIWNGDQGNTPMCVGYAWAHYIEDGPITHSGTHPVVSPVDIYNGAQRLDPWANIPHDGTTVRAGAQYLKNNSKISSYLWAYDVNTLANTVLNVGPVVVGTNWYYNMFFPDRTGRIRVGGYLAGGHAYDINGVDMKAQLFRIKNSWGTSWGQSGHAYISFSDMAYLIKQNGEVCLAVENQF